MTGAKAARGVAVVVDVYRAFTCAPLLFSLGLERSILVADPEEALDMKKKDSGLVLVGEVKGVPIQGFDLGNSPSQILRQPRGFFQARTAVQRTSAGVQGALAALEGADEVLLGSFTLAQAVSHYILSRSPDKVSIVAMGIQLKEKAPEDEWCARFISYLLGAGDYDHNQAMREILFHQTTQKFLKRDREEFPPEDPLLCLQPNIYDFVLRAAKEGDHVVVRRIRVPETRAQSLAKGCTQEAV